MRVAVLIRGSLALLAGCYNPSPQEGAPCNLDGDCPSGLECNAENKCVKPVEIDADTSGPDACPGARCEGSDFVDCDGAKITCANGCGGGASPHCLQLKPSNGLDVSMLAGATADVTMDKLNFDGDDGSIRMQNITVRPAGTGVMAGIRYQVVDGAAVWVANSFKLNAGDSWSLGGTKAIVLFANTSITLDESLDVNAAGTVAGPGGTGPNNGTVAGCQGRAGHVVDGNHAEGGGGGGGANSSSGANGGNTNSGAATGLGGNCATRPSTIPLRGGNGGGNGGQNGGSGGGGGGGAIALVAMESITIMKAVSAAGGGGANGTQNGGGGGGSGGAVLIEAPTVSITGQLTANGGAGGAPSGGAAGPGGSPTTASPAIGPTYTSPGGTTGKGGNGGAAGVNPTNGTAYNYDDTVNLINYNRGGGGGGAVGRVEVKRKTGGVSGLASPAAAITDAVFQ